MPELEEDDKLRRLQAENRRLNSILRLSLEARSDLQKIIDDYSFVRKADLKPIKINKIGAAGRSMTPVALLSDWHSLQVIEAGQTNGLNEHNAEIGQQRAREYFVRLKVELEQDLRRNTVKEAIIWLGGDFLTNCDLHGLDSARQVVQSPAEEVTLITEMLISGIEYLLCSDVPKFYVPCCVGNHGRTTERKMTNSQTSFSWEQVIYQQLATHFKGDKRVIFDVSESNHKMVDVGGFKILFHHGDEGLRGVGGAGGIAVPFRGVINSRWKPTYGQDFTCIGHYHTFEVLRGLGMINGCLNGWDTFAKTMGFAHSKPVQAYFLVDNKRKTVADVRPIWGE